MAVDVTLNNISSGYNLAKINENFTLIDTALQDAVSLSGVTPNSFTADLDMNSNQIINLTNPTNPQDAATKAYADDAAVISGLPVTVTALEYLRGNAGGTAYEPLSTSEVLSDIGAEATGVAAGLDATHAADTSTHGVTTVAGIDEAQVLTNKTLTSPVLNTGVSGTAVLDEDNFASDSATQIATQQSIKAYVDSIVANSGIWSDVSYKTASYTVLITEGGTLFSVDASVGAVTIDLPSIALLNLSGAWAISVKKTDASGNTVTVDANGTDTIDGAGTYILSGSGDGVTLVPDADAAPDEWSSIPFGPVFGNATVDNFAAGVDYTKDSSTTVTLSVAPLTEANIEVYFDGVTQHHNTFTVASTTVTFDAAIPADNVEVIVGDTVSIGTPSDGTVTSAKLSGNLVTPGDLDTTAGTITAAGITSTVDAALVHTDAVSSLKVSGGTSDTLGMVLNLYGQSHASRAHDARFEASGALELEFDSSANLWDFQANAIATTGTLSAGATTITTGASGASSNANADELTLHSSGNGGISRLVPDGFSAIDYWGTASDSIGALAEWDYDLAGGTFTISSAVVGAKMVLGGDDNIANLTLSGASGGELATFAGDIIHSATLGKIYGDSTAAELLISGGTDNNGGVLFITGSTHGAPNEVSIRSNGNVVATFNGGASKDVTLAALAGSGSRTVVADANGKLSAP